MQGFWEPVNGISGQDLNQNGVKSIELRAWPLAGEEFNAG